MIAPRLPRLRDQSGAVLLIGNSSDLRLVAHLLQPALQRGPRGRQVVRVDSLDEAQRLAATLDCSQAIVAHPLSCSEPIVDRRGRPVPVTPAPRAMERLLNRVLPTIAATAAAAEAAVWGRRFRLGKGRIDLALASVPTDRGRWSARFSRSAERRDGCFASLRS